MFESRWLSKCVDRTIAWFTQPLASWLGLSLVVALLYRLPTLYQAFSSDFIVQDDARQHVFWMQRFVDPGLFPNDLLADYFQSVAPWGYTTLYRGGVALGFNPWTFNKILPLLIAFAATIFVFATVLEMVRIPWAAFVSVIFLNQVFPIRDDLVSATPAAFFHPFFLAFLFFTLRRSGLGCAIAILLLSLFYPQGVLVMGGTLGLIGLGLLRWKRGRVTVHGTRKDYWFLGVSLVAVFFSLLPYALRESAYGPVLTLAQARNMFALSAQGWSKFFVDNPLDFWLVGKRTGLFPLEWFTFDLKVIPQVWLTLALPFLILFPGKSSLVKVAKPGVLLLLKVTIASVTCYLLAHLLLFELHLPNRYTEHSFRAIVAVSVGVAMALIADRLRPSHSWRNRPKFWRGLLAIWAIAPLTIGFLAGENLGNYYRGDFPELYDYLKSQSQETLIASLDEEINNIPSFTNRSIFVGGKGFTLPYHLGYYNEVRQRSLDLIEAQYTVEPDIVKDFLDNNTIDLWLITPDMFTLEWVESSFWILQYSQDTDLPYLAVNDPRPTVVESLAETCKTADFQPFWVLDTDCLRDKL
ncbi:hypothetical protein PN498_11980 [Oscillatoria sp. CS-180]|uniref:hypothetical protein n=1 Tax=Oscillatoria sp. CS-180 TaxID=3021720 RepID=UPI00232B91CF|nr:hypothetical protein [Oscillatoria sp. CS-180]MDB9526712.1 hypothetical protein [Oscillatoria sp. CS-180]